LKKQTVSKPIAINDPGSLVENISSVCVLACRSQLSFKFFEQVGPNLEVISSFLGLTEMESVIFCVILNLNLTSESVDLLDIARLLDLTPLIAFTLRPTLVSLVKKQLVKIHPDNTNSPKNRQRSKLTTVEYYIPDALFDSICSGEPFKHPGIKSAGTNIELFGFLREQLQSLLDGTITSTELSYSIQSLLEKNSSLSFVHELEKIGLDEKSQLLFLSVCVEFIDIVDDINLSQLITLLYKNDLQNQMRIRKSFLNNSNPLIEKGLIKIDYDAFRYDGYAELSEEAIKMLLPNRCNG